MLDITGDLIPVAIAMQADFSCDVDHLLIVDRLDISNIEKVVLSGEAVELVAIC